MLNILRDKKKSVTWVILSVTLVILQILMLKFLLFLFGINSSLYSSGTSMEPTYDKGDLLIYKGYPKYEVGNAITFEAGSVKGVSRIIAINEDQTYKIKGDNNPYSADLFFDEIVGRIIFSVNIFIFVFLVSFLAMFISLLLTIKYFNKYSTQSK